jgi:DNA-binding FadR family transcriptional regulator
VIRQLRERLALGLYTVGEKLPSEGELMAQFGVGRSTIREAIRAIAHTGMLEVRQGDGTYVRTLQPADEPLAQRLRRARVVEVHEVRRALELEMARLAALRRDETDVERMRAALHARRAAAARGDHAALLDADVAFHLAVATATRNAVLADLYRAFAAALRGALAEIFSAVGVNEDRTQLHERLAAAIAAGDAAAAQAITADLLDRIDATNTALLGDD